MKAAPKTSRLASLKAAADETGIPYTSLRAIVLRGEIAPVRVGRAIYVERIDVARWIENTKAASA